MEKARYSMTVVEYGCIVDTGLQTKSTTHTAAGIIGTLGTLHPFFVFDVPEIEGNIVRVLLRLGLEAYLSLATSETFTVFGLCVPVAGSQANTPCQSVEKGALLPERTNRHIYGRATVRADDAGHVLTLSLLPSTIHDIQAASGRFAVGIALEYPATEKIDPNLLKVLRFRTNTATSIPQLIVETQPTVAAATSTSAYGLQYDVSDHTIPAALRAVVNSQALALEALLQSLSDSIQHFRARSDLSGTQRVTSLLKLAEETRVGLEALAQKHIMVEKRIGAARPDGNNSGEAKPSNIQLLQALECVNSVLHANIAVARQHLTAMIPTQKG